MIKKNCRRPDEQRTVQKIKNDKKQTKVTLNDRYMIKTYQKRSDDGRKLPRSDQND